MEIIKGSKNSYHHGGKSCQRGHWRPSEDEKLKQLVNQYGPQNWNFIAQHLHQRSGKSCRLRWYNQLDPNINKRPFTEEEEQKLLKAHQIHGNKWASIARLFPGRTDNAVKNHFHVITARKKRECLTVCGKRPGLHCRNINDCDLFVRPPWKVVDYVHHDSKLGFPSHAVNDSFAIINGEDNGSKMRSRRDVNFIDFLGVGITH